MWDRVSNTTIKDIVYKISLPLVFQICHVFTSSPNISMWIHLKFNYVSGLPSTICDLRFQHGMTYVNIFSKLTF